MSAGSFMSALPSRGFALLWLGTFSCLCLAGETAPDYCDQPLRPGLVELHERPVGSAWFHVFEAGEGVLAIAEPHAFQEVISFLVLGQREALLIDSGMGMGDIAALVSELTSLPVSVINTHSHHDHIGGNAGFSRVLALNHPAMRRRAAAGVPHVEVAAEVSPQAFCHERLPGFDPAGYAIAPFAIRESVQDGSRIDLGGRVLEVLATPGHSADSIALLDAENAYLWAGDSYYEGPIWLFAEDTELVAYRSSVARLAALVPKLARVFGAHETPVSMPGRLLELQAALEAVLGGYKTADQRDSGSDLPSPARVYDFGAFSLLIRADLLEAEMVQPAQ